MEWIGCYPCILLILDYFLGSCLLYHDLVVAFFIASDLEINPRSWLHDGWCCCTYFMVIFTCKRRCDEERAVLASLRWITVHACAMRSHGSSRQDKQPPFSTLIGPELEAAACSSTRGLFYATIVLLFEKGGHFTNIRFSLSQRPTNMVKAGELRHSSGVYTYEFISFYFLNAIVYIWYS